MKRQLSHQNVENNTMWRINYFRGCCTFSTFMGSFIEAARREKFPLILVNRLEARQHWRQGLTGAEALLMQWHRVRRAPVSAVFVTFTKNGATCFGKSETLGLETREQDTDILLQQLGM